MCKHITRLHIWYAMINQIIMDIKLSNNGKMSTKWLYNYKIINNYKMLGTVSKKA